MSISNNILLSFDLEEFDIPEEYGQSIDKKTQFSISNEGLKPLLTLLDKYKIRATFFITAHYAENNLEFVKQISLVHEIASHAYYHSSFDEIDLRNSKIKLEELSGKRVEGFRFPRLQQVKKTLLKEAGYSYDSSLNPTYLPGRYNHLGKNRTIFMEDGIIELPTSVVPFIRFPLFWLNFKNLPSFIINPLSAFTLKKDGYLCLYFHPWEFANLSEFKLPSYVKNKSGASLLAKFENYLIYLGKRGTFTTHYDHLMQRKWIK